MHLKQVLADKILNILGWEITGSPPSTAKGIFVIVPHTHWLDFPLGLLARNKLNLDIKFIAKKSLFKGIRGALLRWLGGYLVDRTKNTGSVRAVAEIFDRHEEFYIAIAPEGTRKKVPHLKTGFYYIAQEADVPLYLTKFNFKDKKVEISDPVFTDPHHPGQIREIEDHFRGVRGKNPRYSF